MKSLVLVLLADAMLLLAVFYVVGDLQWRVAYASSPHGHTTGYAASFSYSIFTQVFTMSGSGVTLSSPLTLDWIQVLALVLVVLNGWYVYSLVARRRKEVPRGADVARP